MAEGSPPTARRLTGQELLRSRGDAAAPLRVLDFWRWSASDLLSNATRGILAEWLVALDFGVADTFRLEWAPYDLRTRSGVTVEVKSAAYVQSWKQQRPSKIVYGIGKTRAWDENTSDYSFESRRQADAYVFALLNEKDPERVNPLDLAQWTFYVLPTRVLEERVPTQKTLSLGPLLAMKPIETRFGEVGAAVELVVSVPA